MTPLAPPDHTVIDGPKYIVVIDRHRGIVYRVRKPRVGLMRFSRPAVRS